MVVLMRTLTLFLLLMALTAAPQTPPKIVDVSAERFAFTPSEIKTTVGTPLEIRVTSDDTTHGFRIVGADINVEVPKRGKGVATVKFTPAAPGRYTFECSHTCGAGHSFMRGVIVVTK
jgi:cytochrome c oxidase subunit II